jgi:hypothetical protein
VIVCDMDNARKLPRFSFDCGANVFDSPISS